jgi:geranylgeranyl reductase family protein
MHNFAAIVIGAGPAGLSCARLLAEGGMKVLVLERKNIIGPKVCGGGITWKGLIQRVPEELIDRSFAVQHIFSRYQKTRITSTSPIIATVSRKKLGQWMYRQAVAAGACVMTGMTAQKIDPHQVTAVDDTGTEHYFSYRYLIGADGSSSRVRKYLRLDSGAMGIGIHYRIPGAFDTMEWHLNTRLFGNGYSWIFPFRNHASVGIYTDGTVLHPKEMLQGLHDWAAGHGINLTGLKPRAGLINYDYQGWRFGNKMLIGDAAGLASGLTGEGMYPAIVSGEAAARAIIDPLAKVEDLNRLIRKQQTHRHISRISSKNAPICTMTMELLTMGLRTGAIPINKLEMAD